MRTLIAAAACLSASILAAPASAHSGSVKYVEVSPDERGAQVRVRVSSADAAAATGLGTDVEPAELRERGALMSAWMLRGLSIERAGEGCIAKATPPVLESGATGPAVAVQARFDCGGAGPMALTDSSLEADAEHRTMVRVGDSTHVLDARSPRVAIDQPPSMLATAKAFARQGVVHLVTGYDHVLFLLSLLFAAGVVAHRRGTRRALKEIGLVVTAFTVGHSITLATAALGLVQLNLQLVESVIAASIVAVAAMNIIKPEATMGRPWIALAFGLIHGFGFSSVLAEVGLPAEQTVVALASFNIGIELAQLAVVAIALLPLAWLAQRERLYRAAVMRAGSLAIALLASVWLVERALGF